MTPTTDDTLMVRAHAGGPGFEHEHDLATLERTEEDHSEPPMYQVILINDDFTPMDFVIEVLRGVFSMTPEQAIDVTLQVHHNGRGRAGVYTREIAETKVETTHTLARQYGHPLLCKLEPVTPGPDGPSGGSGDAPRPPRMR